MILLPVLFILKVSKHLNQLKVKYLFDVKIRKNRYYLNIHKFNRILFCFLKNFVNYNLELI
jgi:hypothetical protein